MKDSNRGQVGTAMSGASQPYPGTRAFTPTESHRFFGRASEADRLADLWQANRLTVMHGIGRHRKDVPARGGRCLPLLRDARARGFCRRGLSAGTLMFPVAALPQHNPFTLAVLRSWAPSQADHTAWSA